MNRDIFISVLGHLALIALIIIINPAITIFGNGPEILSVNLGSMDFPESGEGTQESAPPPVVEEEATPLPPPELPAMLADEMIEESFNVRSNEPLAKIEKPKPKPKPKPKKEPKKEIKQQEQQPEEIDQPHETESGGDGKKRLDVQGSVGTGSGASGSAIGSGQSNLTYNLRMLVSKIERSWRNPVRSAEPVFCEVYIVVARNGSLAGTPVIEKSSGISVFDNEVIYAILRAGRFPVFPVSFEYDEIGIHLTFEYTP